MTRLNRSPSLPREHPAPPGRSAAPDNWPSFSIVVPTFRRAKALSRLVEGLARLDYPADRMEVLVVDDGGGLRMDDLPGDSTLPPGLRLLSQEHAGPADARNHGAASATGTYLAFIDDDCLPHPAWLRHLAMGFSHKPHAAIGGAVVNALVHNPFSQASQMVVDHLYEHLNIADGKAGFLASNNLAMARRDFWAVGGFDTGFAHAGGEDRQFCSQWLANGRELHYLPKAVVQHFHHLDLRGFLHQHFRYGKGSRLTHCKTKAHAPRRSGLFPPIFYFRLVGRGVRFNPGFGGLQLSALLLATQLATAAGYLAQALRRTSVKGPHGPDLLRAEHSVEK